MKTRWQPRIAAVLSMAHILACGFQLTVVVNNSYTVASALTYFRDFDPVSRDFLRIYFLWIF